jgi:predicted RNA-binding protein with PIN domain
MLRRSRSEVPAAVLYLIDGYNFLYALGKLRKGPVVLEQVRLYLLRLLRHAHGDHASDVTVVFDAHSAPPGAAAETSHQGIHIRFAIGHAQADDLIEELIRTAAAPKKLTVVSDDHRIQQAARRRQCRVMSCGEYMDWLAALETPRPPRPRSAPPAKPESVSEEETEHWLEEFGELTRDPAWKELFDFPDEMDRR